MNQRIRSNFQTLNTLLSELQNNMNSAIPEIYLKLEQKDDKDLGQVSISNLLWNVLELLPSFEGSDFIVLTLSSFIEDINMNLNKYPSLDKTIGSIYGRMQETIECIKDSKISPIVTDPDSHYGDVFTFAGNTVKVSDFDTFDFIYASQDYNNCLSSITKKCKTKILMECFPYDKWKIGVWFGESPQFNPCKQCTWGDDGYEDVREFIEDISKPIFDSKGDILAENAFEWIGYLSKDNHKFYVLELISSPNARFGQYEDKNEYKTKYPNGAFINEYCLVSGRDDFLNDWETFDDEIAKWMFFDDASGAIVNPDGFISRINFYFNDLLDGSNCIWKY